MKECIVLLLNGQNFVNQKDIIIVFTYVAPEKSTFYDDPETNGIELLADKILSIMSEFPNADLLLAGDFNARTKDHMDFIADDDTDYIFGEHTAYPADEFSMSRLNKDTGDVNAYGRSLIELCCTFNIHILNGRIFGDKEGNFTCFAHDGTSVVDYMIASTELFPKFTHFTVDDFDVSDHLPIHCSLKLHTQTRNETVNDTHANETNTWKKYKWNSDRKEDFITKFRDNFRRFQEQFNNQEISSVSLLTEFIRVFEISAENMKCHTKHNKIFTKQPVWWDVECEQAKRSKHYLLRNFRQTNTRDSLEEYLSQKKRFKKIVKRKKVNLKLINKQTLINSRNNPKQFWNKIKENKIITNNTSKIEPNAWFEYFKQLLCPQQENEYINENLLVNITQNNDPADLNRIITEDEVRQSIAHLHNNKSPGPDGLPAEFFKCTVDLTVPYLTTVFNSIFTTGNIPDSWGKSIICPLLKKGSIYDPNNFRGISLINTVCKIFSNILVARLDKWTDKFNVIHESQAGFRRKYSTIDNIFSLHALVQKYLSKKRGRFYCLFIDFKKAFDSIKHDKLWDALERKGIRGHFLNVWKSLYSKLKSCVKTGDNLTNFFECTIGTRQGCVGSPKIFTLFINDLISYLESKLNRGIFVTTEIPDLLGLMFADDVSCFADTVVGLQRILNELEIFCKSVGINVNFDKTKIVVHRNGGPLRFTEKWRFDGKNAEIVSFYKYLGMFFTPKLVWTKSLKSQALQALKASASIFKYQKNFGFFNPEDAFKLFDSVVKPILCYGSEIWGYKYYEKIEKIQSRFCKRFCCLSPNTPDILALGECGRLPVAITYMVRCLTYWIKLLTMETHRYPKQCYIMLKRLDEVGKITWASHVKEMLYKYGFGYRNNNLL